MRIISGSVGGRKLFSPASTKHNTNIRPTSDRAREAIFNIIGLDKLKNSSVLDLFAGTGALGLEALSRGADKSFFVDNSVESIKLLKRNIDLCGFYESAQILKRDLSKGLLPLAKYIKNSVAAFHYDQKVFDIVFLDPPYDKKLSNFLLSDLQTTNLIDKSTLIIFEDRSKSVLPERVLDLVLHDKRKYGDTGFWLYKLEQSSEIPFDN